ncbi:hypothetical protein B0H11DRAFT_1951541 [Mycena galericulata]|nr:hypothetical protein B0H11DRAFT_1951541 [Mycena galericulata]
MVRAQSAKQRQWLVFDHATLHFPDISAHTLCPILLVYIPQVFQASLLWSLFAPGLRLAQDITPIRCPSQSPRKPSNLQRTGLHSIRCHSSCFLILNCPLSSIVNVSILKSVSLSRFASSYFKTLNHSTTSMHRDFFLQVALKFLLEAQALFFVTHPSA